MMTSIADKGTSLRFPSVMRQLPKHPVTGGCKKEAAALVSVNQVPNIHLTPLMH
jgi:hypothetical protein